MIFQKTNHNMWLVEPGWLHDWPIFFYEKKEKNAQKCTWSQFEKGRVKSRMQKGFLYILLSIMKSDCYVGFICLYASCLDFGKL